MRIPTTMPGLCLLRVCLLGVCLAGVAVAGPAGTASPQLMRQPITQALTDPARPGDQVQLDVQRRPAELIEFAGLKRGDRILDFMPGNAYFTRIFSRVVGARGRVYAFLPAQQILNCEPAEIAGTRAVARDRRYRNVEVLIDAVNHFAAPELLDMVWTSQDYHDLHNEFMRPTDVAALNAAILRALKPGGVYLIIDHVAADGTGLQDTERLHRIDPAAIIAEVTAAGFALEAQSDLLRNPQDSHSLPVFDPAIRHHTDQVVLKFRKPAATLSAR